MKEHRLAVVMNGGVSLAVWMGGLAYELDTVRRASSGLSGPTAPYPTDTQDPARTAEAALFTLWGQHAAAAGTRLTVDVVAGTSAGGLNGVLLAAAIARGRRMTDLRGLWMRAAQFSAAGLLRPQGAGATSVLDSGYFAKQIAAALATGAGPTAEGADVALTVTATSLGGRPRVSRDRTGARFTEPDHRRRYDFRRASAQVTFDPATGFAPAPRDDFATGEALATAAQASAAFPVAFAPVPETDALRAHRSWPDWDTGPEREWLADGGILDNSPFEPVLQAIVDQPVDAPWRRTLCYVVPSADEVLPGKDLGAADQALPPAWTSVLGATLGFPREADLRDDVERLHDLIRSGRTSYDVRRFVGLIAPAGNGTLSTAVMLASTGLPLYVQARAAAAEYEAGDIVAAAQPDDYLAAVPPPVVAGGPAGWLPTAFPTAVPTPWTWGLAAAQRLADLLVRSLADRPDAPDALRHQLSTTAQQVAAVRAAVRAEIVRRATRQATGDAPVTTPIAIATAAFGALEVPSVLGRLVGDAVSAFAAGWPDRAGRTQPLSPAAVLQAALCVEVVNGAGGLPVEPEPRPILDFVRMGTCPPPALLGGEQVATAGSVLYGTRLNHFAAFGREQWRAWDWLWGRIHAAVHLGGLLDLESKQIDEIVDLILAAEGTSAAAVRGQLPLVLAETTGSLLADLQRQGIVRLAADAAWALLGSRARTRPAAPGAARWAAVVGARRHPRRLQAGEAVVRLVATPIRWILRWKTARWTSGHRRAV